MPLSDYGITSYRGVGELQLGMTSQQANTILGEPDDRSDHQYVVCEHYLSQGLIVHYDRETGTCEAVDMVRTARPVYRGQQLMGERWDIIEPWFRNLDENVEETDIGLRSRSVGISISHSLNDDDNDVVDRVFIFVKGYWETEEEYDFTPPGGWVDSYEDLEKWTNDMIANISSKS
jgi:hypothetical protein